MSCSAPDQGGVRVGAGVPEESSGATVIEGQVRRDGEPAAGAYVRLLDGSGEFTAEVVAGVQGQFRFYAAPGAWTVRALAPGAAGESTVDAVPGRTEVGITLIAGSV
ncbi:MAG TPA: DUF1416 domain-containing protein [Kineosporiaceae bacterium]